MYHLLGRQAGAEQPGKLWTHQTAAGRQPAVHHAWHLHLQCKHIFLGRNSQSMSGLSDCREAISIVLLTGGISTDVTNAGRSVLITAASVSRAKDSNKHKMP